MAARARHPVHEAAGHLVHGADGIRARYAGSWIEELIAHLRAVDFTDRTLVIGAELLWSALPLVVLLSSLANTRIDDDISRHLGLSTRGADIVASLFRSTPSHALEPIVTGLLFSLAGVVAVIQSIQVVYERLYDHEPRGWRDLPRYLVWVVVLGGVLIAEGAINASAHGTAGEVLQGLVTFAATCVFFTWTIHFLLHGTVRWRDAAPSAVATALLWVALAFFSSGYFSPLIVSDSRTYGTIGVVFSFLTWFVLIAAVIVLGAALGAVWLNRRTPKPSLSQ